jgi:hypothetical protein
VKDSINLTLYVRAHVLQMLDTITFEMGGEFFAGDEPTSFKARARRRIR